MPIGIAERATVSVKDRWGVNPSRAGEIRRRTRIHNPGTEILAARIVFLHPQESFARMFQVRCVTQLRCFTIQSSDGGKTAVGKSFADPQLCPDVSGTMKNCRVGGVREKCSLSVALLNHKNQALFLRRAGRYRWWLGGRVVAPRDLSVRIAGFQEVDHFLAIVLR